MLQMNALCIGKRTIVFEAIEDGTIVCTTKRGSGRTTITSVLRYENNTYVTRWIDFDSLGISNNMVEQHLLKNNINGIMMYDDLAID